MRILSPGFEYTNFTATGLVQKTKLPIEAGFHKPQGQQPKGPKVRHNQWRYVDYNGDGSLDLTVGIEDWSYYGWDDAWNERGQWTNGTLHGWVYVFVNNSTTATPKYADPVVVEAGGQRLNVFGCPSPNFEDFDRDGDLDLLCGEFLDGFTYFENTGTCCGRSPDRATAADRQVSMARGFGVETGWETCGRRRCGVRRLLL